LAVDPFLAGQFRLALNMSGYRGADEPVALLRRAHLWHHTLHISAAERNVADNNDTPKLPGPWPEGSSVIVYDLACPNDHHFEGWFASSADFERQSESRLLSCPLCGSTKISREAHAPYVSTGSSQRHEPQPNSTSEATPAPQYTNLTPELVSNVIEKLLANTVDVGRAFPEEARKIHYKEAPERAIRGTASAKEVEALRDEGIQVMTLPVPGDRPTKMH
jgi:hypothetical protein